MFEVLVPLCHQSITRRTLDLTRISEDINQLNCKVDKKVSVGTPFFFWLVLLVVEDDLDRKDYNRFSYMVSSFLAW